MTDYVWVIYDGYRDLMDNKSDPRVNNWPMMSGPFPTLALCLFYVYFVKVLGPKLMESRKPFHLRRVMMWYNLLQVLFSAWMFYEALISGWWGDYSLRCQPVDYSDNPKALRMARGTWWYYFSKFTEFMDTIFFVLRKKNNHISTLHVVHHGCMPMSVWFGVKFTPGGHSTFFGLLNTFVHIFMYSYYFLAALGPKVHYYLWWKKYLTTLQMLQFIAVMIHAFQLFFVECNYPRAFTWWIGMHAFIFYFLFRDFYTKTYKKRHSRGNLVEPQPTTEKKCSNHTEMPEQESSVRSTSASPASYPRQRENIQRLDSPKDSDLKRHGVIYANQYRMATGYISDSGLRNRVFIHNRTLRD